MVDVHYAHAKLSEAVGILAVGRGRIKERLTEAANTLTLVDKEIFSEAGMNREAGAYWEKIWSAITTAPQDPQRGVFGPSIDRLTEEEASHIAQLIVSVDAMVDMALDHQ